MTKCKIPPWLPKDLESKEPTFLDELNLLPSLLELLLEFEKQKIVTVKDSTNEDQ